MAKKDIEAALARGVALLDKLLPLKSWLYFPVLYAACVWAVRRVFDYRERILAWQVWLDPEFVRTKPDEFILDFFCVERQLAVEVDGGVHLNAEQAAHDVERSEFLGRRGVHVLRFTNEEID